MNVRKIRHFYTQLVIFSCNIVCIHWQTQKNESLIGYYKILQVLSLSVVYILMSMMEKSDLNTPPHSSSRKFVDLHKQVDKLEDYLSALDKLQNYGVYQTVHYIRSIQVQMLLRSSSPAMYLTNVQLLCICSLVGQC